VVIWARVPKPIGITVRDPIQQSQHSFKAMSKDPQPNLLPKSTPRGQGCWVVAGRIPSMLASDWRTRPVGGEISANCGLLRIDRGRWPPRVYTCPVYVPMGTMFRMNHPTDPGLGNGP